jgi:hypothetical protein
MGVGKPPLHDLPQDLCAFSMKSSRQLLQLGMRLRVQAGLLPHAIALLARLRL